MASDGIVGLYIGSYARLGTISVDGAGSSIKFGNEPNLRASGHLLGVFHTTENKHGKPVAALKVWSEFILNYS